MFGVVGTMIGWLSNQLGLKTDVASATGSVHAKIGDLKNKIGNNTDTRASNTVMGSLSTGIKSWQNVVFTPSSTTGSITIASVNPSKCMITFNGGGSYYSTSDGGMHHISPWLIGITATTVSYGMPSKGSYGEYGGSYSVTVVEFY